MRVFIVSTVAACVQYESCTDANVIGSYIATAIVTSVAALRQTHTYT
jgi:hypothetical protein